MACEGERANPGSGARWTWVDVDPSGVQRSLRSGARLRRRLGTAHLPLSQPCGACCVDDGAVSESTAEPHAEEAVKNTQRRRTAASPGANPLFRAAFCFTEQATNHAG